MPLLDHFRPPLSGRRQGHAFLNAWATYLASDLNRRLPARFFAEANVQFGIEIDVGTFEEAAGGDGLFPWEPAEPNLTVPVTLPTEKVEIHVFRDEGGPVLAAAIELVSPANKDRPAHREAFVAKSAGYVREGIWLVIVDVVTERSANLHRELLDALSPGGPAWPGGLYAAAYRPLAHDGQGFLKVWYEGLEVDRPLPTLPLWVREAGYLPLDLEATYTRTCREQRITA